MAKSSKCSRSKDNSLPFAKRFDNTMVDDDFEELQRSAREENIIQHHFFVSAFVSLGAKPAATPRSRHPPW